MNESATASVMTTAELFALPDSAKLVESPRSPAIAPPSQK
jgi:hypothetical protein